MASEFREAVESIIDHDRRHRYTQDTPIYRDVWVRYCELADEEGDCRDRRVDLLMVPHRQSSCADLLAEIVARLYDYRMKALSKEGLVYGESSSEESDAFSKDGPTDDWLAPYKLCYTEMHVCAQLTFSELICVCLPLTKWWRHYMIDAKLLSAVGYTPLGKARLRDGDQESTTLPKLLSGAVEELTRSADTSKLDEPVSPPQESSLSTGGLWMVQVAAAIWWRMRVKSGSPAMPKIGTALRRLGELLQTIQCESSDPKLWGVSLNRPANTSVRRSVPAIKADASKELFKPDTSLIRWAVIDSGIDATHPAFARYLDDERQHVIPFEPDDDGKTSKCTRIRAAYDFTRLRDQLRLTSADLPKGVKEMNVPFEDRAKQLRKSLVFGGFLDWERLVDKLVVKYSRTDDGSIVGRPLDAHGTHVAGVLGAWWKDRDVQVEGVCPDIEMYDLRVVDKNGLSDEFSVLAAMQFVRNRNALSDRPVIHGVNISMSIRHDVQNFGCGHTPVCDEANRLASSGVVVVAAAGNGGYVGAKDRKDRDFRGYQSSTITDPGNAEKVITVGATHRHQPHRYGVSYFSSRGPTGDGRMKPDLVAPGEKVVSPVPGDRSTSMDGTSMAAPHVSGAAALLMARHTELIGDPERIKRILCDTATDLGRDQNHQGAGMLDILRALQSI